MKLQVGQAIATGRAILVVGGAGYTGSHTARALRRHGYEVIIYDNLSTGHSSPADGFELIVGDIADEEKLAHVLTRTSAVIHFAAHAYVGESTENPRKYFRNNVEAALTLLNTAIDAGVRVFVFSSSCVVYGVPSKMPIGEGVPRQPINPYGVSKLFLKMLWKPTNVPMSCAPSGCDTSMPQVPTRVIPLALATAAGTGPELQLFGTDYSTPDGHLHPRLCPRQRLGRGTRPCLAARDERGRALGFESRHRRRLFHPQVLAAVQEVTGRAIPWRAAPRRPGDRLC